MKNPQPAPSNPVPPWAPEDSEGTWPNTELRGQGEAQVRLERFARGTGQMFGHQRQFLTPTQCVCAASGSGSAANPPGPPAQPSGPAAPAGSCAAAGRTPAGCSAPSCSPPGAAGRPEQLPRRKPEDPSQSFPQEPNEGSQSYTATRQSWESRAVLFGELRTDPPPSTLLS